MPLDLVALTMVTLMTASLSSQGPICTGIPGQGTCVGGVLSTPAVWDLAGSPYILTGVLSVRTTLTINPGVTVRFSVPGHTLQVGPMGTLIAVGTSASPIRFEPAPLSTWNGGIEFSSTAVSATYAPNGDWISGSRMSYCKLTSCANPLATIRLLSCAPLFEDCTIVSSSGGGWSANQSSGLVIRRSFARQCAGNGIRLIGCQFTTINDTLIDGCSGDGIFIQECANTTISDTRCHRNLQSGIEQNSSSSSSFENCQIALNNGGGILVGNSQSTTVVDSIVAANRNSSGVAFDGCDNSQVTRCVIVGNFSQSQGGGLWHQSSGVAVIEATKLLFNRSLLVGGGIYARGQVSVQSSPNAPTVIISNEAGPGYEGDDFYNNAASGPSEPDIPAMMVCWGTKSSRATGRIFDGAVNQNYTNLLDDPPMPCEGFFHDLAGGIPGVSGVPSLIASGDLVPTTPLTIALVNAAPNALFVLSASPALDYLVLDPLDLLIAPGILAPATLIPLMTDATGSWSIPVVFPAPLPYDTTIVLQALVYDTSSPNGIVSQTNALVGIR